jgi:hypothetical protein
VAGTTQNVRLLAVMGAAHKRRCGSFDDKTVLKSA